MSELPTSSFFDLTRDGAVVEIRMNKPDKANAMSPDFWDDLPVLLYALEADPTVRVVVLTGAGKSFSGGMDLATFNDISALLSGEPARAAFALRQMILKLQETFTAIEQVRMPVIAAIQGACIGGAVDLISACDIRLASADATFSIEEVNIGMTADVGTLQRLPKLIPMGLVMELALTGRRFGPDEAASWGLVNAVHPDHDALRVAAFALAQSLAEKSPVATAGIKRSVLYARDHSVADGLDQIATWNAGMLRPEDMKIAMQARMAKKAGTYKDLLGG